VRVVGSGPPRHEDRPGDCTAGGIKQGGMMWLDDVQRDVRFAVRPLLRSRGSRRLRS